MNPLLAMQRRNGEPKHECYTALNNWLNRQGFKSTMEENAVVSKIPAKKYYGVSVWVRHFYDVFIQADNQFRFILKNSEGAVS